ncbi:MAG: EAL domain-containing protein [Solirubrobacterales bacterium]|nr:EAL domain-containing protein [Solirubrobacterales bacterium]
MTKFRKVHDAVATRRVHPKRRLVVVVALLAGLMLSLGVALVWRSAVRAHDRQAFVSTASNATDTLGTLLRRDSDFLATLQTILSMQPHMSASAFNMWYQAFAARERQLGSVGNAVVASVPASQLTRFEVKRDEDPAFQSLLGRWIVAIPRRNQNRYCLLAAGGALIPINGLTARFMQEDWCQPSSMVGSVESSLLSAATDSGQYIAYSVDISWLHTLFLEAAVYRRGAPLATVAERRAALTGWVVNSFDIPSLIRTALAHDPGVSIALYHRNPGQSAELIGAAGPGPRGGDLHQNTQVTIDGAWTVKVCGPRAAAALNANVQAALVMAAGAVITLLVLLLARSRERALALVAEKTRRLRHLALHDALTGLPNRVLALDRAEQMLARARRHDAPISALYIDLDGFKHINDSFGHAAGDELLELVADRLAGAIRESDTAARLAGDEFVVLLDSSEPDAGPELVAERVLEVLRKPFELGGEVGRPLSLTASIGVALGLHGTAEALLADSDVAMYVAKTSGKNRYVVFEPGMQTASQDRLALEMDLGDALAERQFFLLYQPLLDLRTGQPIGAEALLRWRHPTRGIVAPDKFIPIAEDSALIVPIGRWVLEQACRDAARWRWRGHLIGISVNVSARQLDSDELIDHVRQALEDSGLEPSALTLEITETALMRDAQATAQRLEALKRLGVRVAIDDFGTGYSSLAYLRQFTVDALKIDRSFISGIGDSGESTALIRTLVRLGKTLGLETVAEGIETEAQLAVLQRHRCDHGQGFLYSRPVEVEALVELLGAWERPAVTRTPAA